ncbi:hypothetical protein M1N16_02320 [Nitrospinaceae bacterium]|nr:hypothetical protein [Nitrospinaceae bacterium]
MNRKVKNTTKLQASSNKEKNPKKTGKSRLSGRPFPDQYLTDFTQISSGEYSTA